jgi:predicted nuclease of predicted toxin-antitoxin system
MTRRPYKHKLLLDENFPPRRRFPKLNELYDVKHIILDLHQREGQDDPAVYEIARKQQRLLITRNFADFRNLPTPSDTAGVIGMSGNLTYNQIDTKLVAFLKKESSKSLYSASHYISGES